MQNGHYTYSYSGTNITVRRYYEGGIDLFGVDSILYDANNNIVEIIRSNYSLIWNDTVKIKYLLDYANNKMSGIRYVEFLPWGTDTSSTMISWDAVGNIKNLVHLDNQGNRFDSAVYIYNSNENYFRTIHPHFWLFDPGFNIQEELVYNFPYFYSKNNVTSFYNAGGLPEEVEYSIDSAKKITGLRINGEDYVQYKYKCE